MTERLIINNFGGIKFIDINLNKLNVVIGPQATGKSICAKLLFFFKNFDNRLITAAENNISKRELDKSLINKFTDYFPSDTFPKQNFNIRYEINASFVEITKDNDNKIELIYSDDYKKIFTDYKRLYKRGKNASQEKFNPFESQIEIREKYLAHLKEQIGEYAGFHQLFIPAGRSFFATVHKNIFSLLLSNEKIDPFLIEFGSFYERIKDTYQIVLSNKGNISDSILEEILTGKYHREKGNDFLIHSDGRKTDIAYSSSGQQETLPLILILRTLMNIKFISNGVTIYIEEPEAHIFPDAQKLIVELIAYVFNSSNSNYQFFITTHSPYILTSFNNLIQAGIVENEANDNTKKDLYKIINKDFVLKLNTLNAYSLQHDNFCNLINTESGLIAANKLDTVSNNISIEFDKLLNLI